MFTTDNTEGFTAEELELLNEALRFRMKHYGEDEKAASDRINNLWMPGAIFSELVV